MNLIPLTLNFLKNTNTIQEIDDYVLVKII